MANTAINHDPVATFPGSSTNTAVVKWSGTSGNALLDSGVLIDGSNNVTGLNNVTATGYLHLTGDEKELRFYEGANYIAIKTNSSLAANYTLTLPLNDGSADEFLQTNGSGVLTWAAAAGTTINSNADNRVITGSGSANTLEGESTLLYGSSVLTLNASNVTTAQLIVHGYGDSGTDGPGRVSIRRSRTATIGGNGALSSGGDYIGVIEFAGNDGNSVETSSSIRTESTENWTDSAHGTMFRIFVTANGSTTQLPALKIDQDFDVSVKENNSTPSVTKGLAKVWVGINTDGTNDGDYNLTSTGKDSTGVYSVTIATDFSSENFAAVASARTVNATMAMVTTFSVGSYKVQTEDDGDTLVDAASYTGAWGYQA